MNLIRRLTPLIAGVLALVVVARAIFWFQDQIIPEPEPIKVNIPHRETPPIISFKIASCRKHKGYIRNACLNKAFGI